MVRNKLTYSRYRGPEFDPLPEQLQRYCLGKEIYPILGQSGA